MKINSINPQYQKNYKKTNAKQNYQTPSFKGYPPEAAANKLSKLYTKVADSKLFQNFANSFSKSNKTFTHLLIAESILLSGFYMINTLRNDKIKKEQKPQMLINDTLTLGVSAAGAYLAEDKITNLVKKGSEKYFEKYSKFYTDEALNVLDKMVKTPATELIEKVGEVVGNYESSEKFVQGLDDVSALLKTHLRNITSDGKSKRAFELSKDGLNNLQSSVKRAISENLGNAEGAKSAVGSIVKDSYIKSAARQEADKAYVGFNKLKVLIIFGIIYRYLGPVVITPIANKISSKFFDKKKDKKADEVKSPVKDENPKENKVKQSPLVNNLAFEQSNVLSASTLKSFAAARKKGC